MKKIMNRAITMLVVICVLISMSVSAFAASYNTDPVNMEEAWFPAEMMCLTQVAYENASHGAQNAIDLVCYSKLIAPFTGRVVFVDKDWGYVAFQSEEKVRYANGDVDFMTVCFMHSNNIDDLVAAYRNNAVIMQGTPIYQQGGMGNGNPHAYGNHVHLSVYRGKYTFPKKYGNGDVYAFDAFWVNPDITTSYSGRGEGYAIQYVSNSAPYDYRGRWKELDYLSGCTFYQSLANTVQISKKTTFKTLPCSKKTCEESADVRMGKRNERIKVVGLVRNSVGNYWYAVLIEGNTIAYLFAGDAKLIESWYNRDLYDSPDGYHLVQGWRIIN